MGDLFEVKFEDACPYVCDGTKFLCNAKPLGLFHTTHVGVGLQYEFLKGDRFQKVQSFGFKGLRLRV